jgi:hypothetical protein
MIDWQTIYLVTLIIYSVEAIQWVTLGTALFYKPWFSSWRVRTSGWPVEAIQREALWSPLLPPFGRTLLAAQDSFRFGVHGCWHTSRAAFRNADRHDAENYLRYSDIRQLSLDGSSVKANGSLLQRFNSDGVARHCFEFLKGMMAANPEERIMAIRSELTCRTDVRDVVQVIGSFEQNSRFLLLYCTLQFTILVIIFPTMSYLLGFELIWLPLLIVLVLSGLAIVREFSRLRRSLPLTPLAELPGVTATICLSPVSAVHAYDELFKRIVEMHDPLAVAAAIMDRSTFAVLAGTEYRALVFPAVISIAEAGGGESNPSDPKFASDLDWERKLRTELMEKLMRKASCSPEQALASPIQHSEQSISYCPRCHAQYVVRNICCVNCLRPVVPFAAA